MGRRLDPGSGFGFGYERSEALEVLRDAVLVLGRVRVGGFRGGRRLADAVSGVPANSWSSAGTSSVGYGRMPGPLSREGCAAIVDRRPFGANIIETGTGGCLFVRAQRQPGWAASHRAIPHLSGGVMGGGVAIGGLVVGGSRFYPARR
jgi:hypothetical protein